MEQFVETRIFLSFEIELAFTGMHKSSWQYTVIARNKAHTEITPVPVYTPMCSRSGLSARKKPMPKYTPRIRMRRINKMVAEEHPSPSVCV